MDRPERVDLAVNLAPLQHVGRRDIEDRLLPCEGQPGRQREEDESPHVEIRQCPNIC